MLLTFTGQRNPAYTGDMASLHIGADVPDSLGPVSNVTGIALGDALTGPPSIADRPVFRDVDTASPAARFGTTVLLPLITWALPDFTDGACGWTRNIMRRGTDALVLHTCYPSLTTDSTLPVTGFLFAIGGRYEFTIPGTTDGPGEVVSQEVEVGDWWPVSLLYPPPIDHADAMGRLAAWRNAPIP